MVEDDWEAALVHISHPGFNQPLVDQTKENWTQEDSQNHWMKTDVRYIPKRADGTAPIQVTKQIHLPPGYYYNLKEAWIAIAYEMEKQHMEVMMDIAKMDVDDQAKRQQLAALNLAQPYVKITNAGIASELDSLYVLIPANMEFEMEWKLAGLMGLVKDGTSTQTNCPRKKLFSETYRGLQRLTQMGSNERSCQQISTVWSCLRQLYPPRFRV